MPIELDTVQMDMDLSACRSDTKQQIQFEGNAFMRLHYVLCCTVSDTYSLPVHTDQVWLLVDPLDTGVNIHLLGH